MENNMKYTCENIFSKTKTKDFLDFLNFVNAIESIDIDFLYKDYCNKNKELNLLYDKWIASLGTEPDYSLYGDKLYLNESFICWKKYSRRYLMLIKKYLDREDCKINKSEVNNILDIGCGCAFSTVGLKSLFPEANVMATNLSDTLQYKIDCEVVKNTPGIKMYDDKDIFNLGNVDLVFASEFFEHLTEPISYLKKIIDTYHPKYIVYANTFTQMSLGHFNSYENGLVGIKTSLAFSKTLRENGYSKVETRFFNNRPYIYKLGD